MKEQVENIINEEVLNYDTCIDDWADDDENDYIRDYDEFLKFINEGDNK